MSSTGAVESCKINICSIWFPIVRNMNWSFKEKCKQLQWTSMILLLILCSLKGLALEYLYERSYFVDNHMNYSWEQLDLTNLEEKNISICYIESFAPIWLIFVFLKFHMCTKMHLAFKFMFLYHFLPIKTFQYNI